ncbi:melanotransferrin isoform x2 [Limosa lapponica baueri]|uniref:Ovotransferrin n=1 Tax=Limosa lapponica baueri TaxID=1758121 RepID=A0A2I0UNI1_LIMLA|nr:melanotransferrin isoform x2 [Limosa lapponica baueri]
MKSSRNVFYLLFFHAALGLERVRWCTVSEKELSKCNAMSEAFGGAGILPPLECTAGGSAANCTQMIKDDLADAVTLDGRLIYQAGKEHGLKPVVGEVYDQEIGTSYYAVAVVKKGSNITINSLKGVSSCHTGINRTAGWDVPVGYLVDSGRMAAMGCDLPKAVSDYFNASCVPGANGANYPKSLCQLCKGDSAGQNKCERNSQEQYYDYSGAFRADVEAEASALPDTCSIGMFCLISGRSLSSWARQLRSQDFQLLCRDGSTADVTEWRTCHLARIPARAVVVRPDTDGTAVFQLLNQGQQRFNGVGTKFQMFDSAAYSAQNLLFRDATTELVAITAQNYQAWLGDEYLHAMQALSCNPNTDDNSNAYYAVVLVKRNSSNAFTISDLKGKKSCHTGLGRNAGWNIPIGMLIKRGIIKTRDCDIPQAVSEFFSASCVPSAKQDNYPAKLCQLCIGDNSGNNKCSASSQERYYSYSGAFRCLAQDSGDVAFVKHSTVFENTDGKNTESWAQNLKSGDFQLLCLNGARAEVTQFAECHLARVPAQAVMVHPDTSIFALYGLLDKAQVYFGNSSNENGFKMFDSSTFQGKDLIFKDSAVQIVPVEERRTYAEWLGSEYIESLEGMQTPECAGAGNQIRQYLLMTTVIPLLTLCQIQALD